MPDFTKGMLVGAVGGSCIGLAIACLILFPTINQIGEVSKPVSSSVWKN